MAAMRANPTDLERIYTNEEFEALPSEYERFELIDGRLVEKMPGGDQHGRIARRLDYALGIYALDNGLGETWRDTTFRIAPGFEPIPDLAFIMAERVPAETSGVATVRPDLAVEVHSPRDLASATNRATAHKITEYQKNGIPLLWIINPATQTIEVYHPEQPTPVQVLNINGELDGENIIPGFTMKVADLFR